MHARRFFRFTAAACLVGAATAWLSAGCVRTPSTDATNRPPRHKTWWNFYQRGVALSYTGNYKAAAENFEICLGLKRGAVYGYPRDTWRARTYGFHFLDDYFPHRALGVCFYHLGETSNAVHFLERSLHQQPSGRARHFLNLARAPEERRRSSFVPTRSGRDYGGTRKTGGTNRAATAASTVATGDGQPASPRPASHPGRPASRLVRP
ncbi:MAG: hypothetical protein KKC51_10115 [Verrucomicrobia bacterium]|nr:hypothetical protein [Verrucomicrobiota bacterium]